MLHKYKLIKAVVLCIVIMVTFVSCDIKNVSKENDEITELKWYINFSWFNTGWGENAVSKKITEDTGVIVDFVVPQGSENEKLNALIAGESLPDIITLGWWDSHLQGIIDNGYVYSLNELADKYDMHFYEVTDEKKMKWYAETDGNTYRYPNSSYTPEDYKTYDNVASNQTFLVRKDIYEAIGSPDMTTTDGFVSAIKKAAEMFGTINGQPIIPIGLHEFTNKGCDSFDYLMNFINIPHEKDGAAYDRLLDPEYKRWLLAFRELGELGLLTNDVFIDKRIQMEEKIADGRYFCMLYQRSDFIGQQKLRYANDPDSIYIAIDGPTNINGTPHALPASGIEGWTVTLISKNCTNPEKAIKLFDYLISEEGQKLIYFGVEGKHYTEVDGIPVMNDDIKKLYDEDYTSFVSEVGGDNTYWMFQDNAMQSKWIANDDPALIQMQNWALQYTVYTGQYNTSFEYESELYKINEKLERSWGTYLPMLLNASSEDEFNRIYDEMVKKREEIGVDKLLDEKTVQMTKNKEKLGFTN